MDRQRRALTTWARWGVRGVILGLVVLLAAKTAHGLLGTFDVGFDDETIYLEGAHWLGKRFLPLAESSPLYPKWYRMLSWFEPDPMRLYFVNWYVQTLALPGLLFVLARRSGASLVAAAAVAAVWSTSSAVMTWPFVSKFATLVLGASALAATFPRDRRLAAAITAAGLALAAYARAELTLPSFAFAGTVAVVTLVTVVRRPADRRTGMVAIAIALLVPLALRLGFGDPHQGGRAFFAFGQHYALNVVEAKHLAIDPWTTWDRFAREAFPHATTIGEAFRENRSEFLWHIERNIRSFPLASMHVVEPLSWMPRWVLAGAGTTVVLVLLGAVLGGARRPLRIDPRLGNWMPFFGILVLATLASTLLIYPREHYLLPLAWFTLAGLAAHTGRLRGPARLDALWEQRVPEAARAWIAPALVVAGLIALAVVLPTRREAEPKPRLVLDNVETIKALRRLNLQGHVPILESEHSRGFYAGIDYVRVAQWAKNEPFWEFMHREKVDAVILTWRLREDPRFKSDPAFVAFDNGTGEREDFVMMPVEQTSVVVAVRRSVLDRSGR